MSTISVPVSPKLEELIESLVKRGYGASKADVVRKALILLAEEEAVRLVLLAEQEPTLKGDLKKLAKKL
ncbi:MAG: hypothetical protein A2390_00370 [Candidatus Liptonbacteria bacterium RIFOXYB1_FULL_36_10]|uniref:Ribbon-helix-helix protein CopG domain-containing protein n=2 Tax=Candidatus Liptoniibacteriota TaxID=1817909 RepID=A0A1G2CLV8_9BACT|nr:MAG: hypothetical protein A2390_00370 [Candidatus Liptonbacteria bacterium RIFOXYB1_FULL_36_10]OGZ04608.1 MAG: hypothetical protein A2604_00305 [Candidatus Liptonbacteria bacterium RIFOXYD1_FULL_36_11]